MAGLSQHKKGLFRKTSHWNAICATEIRLGDGARCSGGRTNPLEQIIVQDRIAGLDPKQISNILKKN
jgi:hypothetical protein